MAVHAPTWSADHWNTQIRVIGAVILRDMRTRFGRSHLGYLFALAWPLFHMLFIFQAFMLGNAIIPFVSEPGVFIATGIVPYILCLYPARLIMQSVDQNRALLMFPIVRVFDIIIARSILEMLTVLLAGAIFVFGMYLAGYDIWPQDPLTAMIAIMAAIYVGLCLGYLNTIIQNLFRFWMIVFILLMILLYSTSGALRPISDFPEPIRAVLWFNPIVHLVEWMRTAFYEGYGIDMLSKPYLLGFATYCLFLGLMGERFIRGRLLIA